MSISEVRVSQYGNIWCHKSQAEMVAKTSTCYQTWSIHNLYSDVSLITFSYGNKVTECSVCLINN